MLRPELAGEPRLRGRACRPQPGGRQVLPAAALVTRRVLAAGGARGVLLLWSLTILAAGAIEAAVDQVIADNPAQVAKVGDNPKLAGWFVGQVMKQSRGKADPQLAQSVLEDILSEK